MTWRCSVTGRFNQERIVTPELRMSESVHTLSGNRD